MNINRNKDIQPPASAEPNPIFFRAWKATLAIIFESSHTPEYLAALL